jgi:hypothetical protein
LFDDLDDLACFRLSPIIDRAVRELTDIFFTRFSDHMNRF